MYLIAGIYGVLCLLPGFFTESQFAAFLPPAVTHPEFYYGFYGITLAWQIAFLVIARDPARLVSLMPVTVLEKAAWVITISWLVAAGRTSSTMFLTAAPDALLGILFVASYLRVSRLNR